MRKEIGGTQLPLICSPIVAADQEGLRREVQLIMQKPVDAVEWRADYYRQAADIGHMLETAQLLRELVGDTVIIFTFRAEAEGGQPTRLSMEQQLNLCQTLARKADFDYIDCELSLPQSFLKQMLETAQESAVKLIGSYHNFQCTPESAVLDAKLDEAKAMGFDVAKIAVMPTQWSDVLRLLQATDDARSRNGIPLIAGSMGQMGAVTRIAAFLFGSNLSFAVGANVSGPGQIPVDDQKTALDIVCRASGI